MQPRGLTVRPYRRGAAKATPFRHRQPVPEHRADERLWGAGMLHAMAVLPAAFYEPDGTGFASTALTRGPWDLASSTPGCRRRCSPARDRSGERDPGRPDRPPQLTTSSARPDRAAADPDPYAAAGRCVEQIEATTATGEAAAPLMRATAWRMRSERVGLPDGAPPTKAAGGRPRRRPPGRPVLEDEVADRALDWRFVHGASTARGPPRSDASTRSSWPASPRPRSSACS